MKQIKRVRVGLRIRLMLGLVLTGLLCSSNLTVQVNAQGGECYQHCMNKATEFINQCTNSTGDGTNCSQAGADLFCSCMRRVCNIGGLCG